jgi:hypothetical protein
MMENKTVDGGDEKDLPLLAQSENPNGFFID